MIAPVVDTSDYEVVERSCKSDTPPQEPEVLVDVSIDPGEKYVRIPVVKAELWLNKDGPANITRTAKITFPTEWGGESISAYVDGFDGITDPFGNEYVEPSAGDDGAFNVPDGAAPTEEYFGYDTARVWFYDDNSGQYRISHFGYVGGVGPASGTGEMKMWVYDPADLLSRIPVTQSYSNPSLRQIFEFVLSGRDENGTAVGIANRTVFNRTNVLATKTGQEEESPPGAPEFDVGVDRSGTASGILDGLTDAADNVIGAVVEGGKRVVTPRNTASDVVSGLAGFIFNSNNSQKNFKRNRDTMADVLNWYADRVGGIWYFTPTPASPQLVFEYNDSDGLTRREYVEETIVDRVDVEPTKTVTTLDNTALRDMKPFNTLVLSGQASDAGVNSSSFFQDAASQSAVGEAYPFVELVYPPLLQRAGGYEYTKTVEPSDKLTLEGAFEEALATFRKELSEETEGQIELRGEPTISPYDNITTVTACDGTFPNATETEIRYEVNSVKHVREANSRYKTLLGASLAIDESAIEYEAGFRPV